MRLSCKHVDRIRSLARLIGYCQTLIGQNFFMLYLGHFFRKIFYDFYEAMGYGMVSCKIFLYRSYICGMFYMSKLTERAL